MLSVEYLSTRENRKQCVKFKISKHPSTQSKCVILSMPIQICVCLYASCFDNYKMKIVMYIQFLKWMNIADNKSRKNVWSFSERKHELEECTKSVIMFKHSMGVNGDCRLKEREEWRAGECIKLGCTFNCKGGRMYKVRRDRAAPVHLKHGASCQHGIIIIIIIIISIIIIIIVIMIKASW